MQSMNTWYISKIVHSLLLVHTYLPKDVYEEMTCQLLRRNTNIIFLTLHTYAATKGKATKYDY